MTKKIFIISLFAATLPLCGEDVKLTGAWNVKGPNVKSADTAIIQSGDNVTMLTRQPQEKWILAGTGKVTNDMLILSLTNQQFHTTELKIDDEKNLIPATPQKTGWKCSKLSALYVCSNHSPTNHVAISFSEMKHLTQEFHCTGWHGSDAAAQDESKLIQNMIEMPAAGTK